MRSALSAGQIYAGRQDSAFAKARVVETFDTITGTCGEKCPSARTTIMSVGVRGQGSCGTKLGVEAMKVLEMRPRSRTAKSWVALSKRSWGISTWRASLASD